MLLLKPIGRGNWASLTLRLDGSRAQLGACAI